MFIDAKPLLSWIKAEFQSLLTHCFLRGKPILNVLDTFVKVKTVTENIFINFSFFIRNKLNIETKSFQSFN
jgi:hypothetical protein